MNRALVVLIVGGALLLAVVGRPGAARARVYTVAQVWAGLSRHPRQWLDTTILVRGLIVGCLPGAGCAAMPPGIPNSGLVDGIPIFEMPRTTVLSRSLPLQVADDPLRALLRRIPLLNRVMAMPRLQLPAQPATYRVRLIVARPCAVENMGPPCIEALLVDPGKG